MDYQDNTLTPEEYKILSMLLDKASDAYILSRCSDRLRLVANEAESDDLGYLAQDAFVAVGCVLDYGGLDS